MTDNFERFGGNIDDAYEGGYGDAERDHAAAMTELAKLRRERAVVAQFLDTDAIGTTRQDLLHALTKLAGGDDRG